MLLSITAGDSKNAKWEIVKNHPVYNIQYIRVYSMDIRKKSSRAVFHVGYFT